MYNYQNNKIINLNSKIIKASGFVEKLTGLIFRRLKDNEIFLINNCNGVHTLWMTRPIDVVFLNRQCEVVALFMNFKIFRFTPFIKNAVMAIEAETGFIQKNKISHGDTLIFQFSS